MKHVPNVLTAARLVAAPYIFWLLWSHEYGVTLVWFAIIAATDALDGYIARRFDGTSKLGAYLDPIADKVLLSGTFLTLGVSRAIPVWLAGVVLGRDALILIFAAGALLFTRKRRDFSPSQAGKFSTFLQILYVIGVLAAGAGYLRATPGEIWGWTVAAVTIISGLEYARRAFLTRE